MGEERLDGLDSSPGAITLAIELKVCSNAKKWEISCYRKFVVSIDHNIANTSC